MDKNPEKPKIKRQKIEARPLNQDLIEQCPRFGLISRRNQLNPSCGTLEDKHKSLGDVWTPHRSYDLFIYHYKKKYRHRPILNPWNMNLAKLVMPNVFVNVELIKKLARNYNPKMRAIYSHDGSQLIIITHDYICMVFQLETSLKKKMMIRDFLEEYKTMDTSYKWWKLPLHRPKGPGNQLKIFSSGKKPPFHVDSFEEYYQYTYYLVGQALGIDALADMTIAPMVLAIDLQSQDVRPYDYAEYLS